MSTRHLETIQRMLAEGTAPEMPTKEILALPDRLDFCMGYEPTAFGVPGGPPRMLGPEYPIVVDGRHTFIYVRVMPDVVAYVKLEEPK